MIVGLIAEGRADLAVITNILKGCLGLDRADIRYLLPEYRIDETDLHTMRTSQYSNWTLVRDYCIDSSEIDNFFNLEEDRLLVIHFDTDRCNDTGFDVTKPIKKNNSDYCLQLRDLVIDKVKSWLGSSNSDKIRFAIVIEEIDAWVLTIYTENNDDTSKSENPKDKLNRILSKNSKLKNLLREKEYPKYSELSKKFRKKRDLEKFAKLNSSLKLFISSI